MAYTKYSLTPSNNNAAPPDGAPEGMLPSAVNDTMRDMMAQIRDCGDGIRGGTYTMTAPVITGGSITGAALSGNTLTSPVITGGSINNTPIGASTASTGAFTNLSASANSVISVTDNSNAALRITQLGTGNALLVEDSANPDSSPFVIDSGGTIIRGYTSNIFSTGIQSVSTSVGAASIAIGSFSASGLGAPLKLYHSRSGVIPTNTILQSGDETGKLEFYGADGTGYIQSASISAAVDGTPGTNDMPGRLIFSTTADGASSPTERMRIDSSGNVGIGTSSPSGKFHANSAAGANFIVGFNNTSVNFIDANTNVFRTGSFVETMRIDSAGRVGVNITSPDCSFHINASSAVPASEDFPVAISAAADNNKALRLGYDTANDIGVIAASNLGSGWRNIAIQPTGSNGVVGIGLNPTARNNTCLQVANGIGFPATQVASSDANTLDDYEEGTWTPTLVSTGGAAPAYTTQTGKYFKIGGIVYVYGTIQINGTVPSGNYVRIQGLPFSQTSGESGVSLKYNGMTNLTTAGQFVAAAVGGAEISMARCDSTGELGVVGLQASYLGTATRFIFSAFYQTA